MPGILAVAAPLAVMDASGTGTIETQQHTTAAHTSVTHEFRTTLSASHNLFAAFSWADVDTEGNVDASSGQTDFTISLDQAMFAAALKSVIETATGGKATSSFGVSTNVTSVPAAQSYNLPSNLGMASATAETVMDREIRLEVEAELDANGVLEYLEGDSLGNFALHLDASGGAADMADKLGASNTAELRNLLLQFPNRTDVIGLTDASGARLPVKAGDAVAFVFSVSPAVYITEVNQAGDAPGANTTGNEASAALNTANMATDGVTILSTGTRKIVFTVDVTE